MTTAQTDTIDGDYKTLNLNKNKARYKPLNLCALSHTEKKITATNCFTGVKRKHKTLKSRRKTISMIGGRGRGGGVDGVVDFIYST